MPDAGSNAETVTRIKRIASDIASIRSTARYVSEVKDELIPLCLGGDISEGEFYRVSSILTPQSRSPMWEKYFMMKYGAISIRSQENAGDFILDGVHYEYKASSNDEGVLHIVQIRLWQNCDYLIQHIEPEKKVITFCLRHADMEQEMTKRLSISAAHGTKEANEKNENVELRTTIEVGSDDWRRWLESYLWDKGGIIDLM